MKLSGLEVNNFGPISKGVFRNKRINIFFGPNNSGKSMIARLIHAFSLDPTESVTEDSRFMDYIYYVSYRMVRREKRGFDPDSRYLSRFSQEYVSNALGIVDTAINDLILHGKTLTKLTLYSDKKSLVISLHARKGQKFPHISVDSDSDFVSHLLKKRPRGKRVEYDRSRRRKYERSSVYIPAARTGILQFFNSITHMRSSLLNSIVHSFGSTLTSEKETTGEIRKFLKLSLLKSPLYLTEFYELILESQREGLIDILQSVFHVLYEGQLELRTERGIPTFYFRDVTGFATEIEQAGSGVVSSFPILLGMHRVSKGGTLIVEEPEAHLEPSRQMKLIKLLCDYTKTTKTNLFITTHSDYVLKKILGMVNKGDINRKDIGLFYFNRSVQGSTTIEEIEVTSSGEAEQPLFQEALNQLVEDFS